MITDKDSVERWSFHCTLSWRRSLSYRNQSIDLRGRVSFLINFIKKEALARKSMDWFLCDRDLRHERVKLKKKSKQSCLTYILQFSLCITMKWCSCSNIFISNFELLWLFLSEPFKHQPHKIVKHTQTIRRQITDKLFECVWSFCGVGT